MYQQYLQTTSLTDCKNNSDEKNLIASWNNKIVLFNADCDFFKTIEPWVEIKEFDTKIAAKELGCLLKWSSFFIPMCWDLHKGIHDETTVQGLPTCPVFVSSLPGIQTESYGKH